MNNDVLFQLIIYKTNYNYSTFTTIWNMSSLLIGHNTLVTTQACIPYMRGFIQDVLLHN